MDFLGERRGAAAVFRVGMVGWDGLCFGGQAGVWSEVELYDLGDLFQP